VGTAGRSVGRYRQQRECVMCHCADVHCAVLRCALSPFAISRAFSTLEMSSRCGNSSRLLSNLKVHYRILKSSSEPVRSKPNTPLQYRPPTCSWFNQMVSSSDHFSAIYVSSLLGAQMTHKTTVPPAGFETWSFTQTEHCLRLHDNRVLRAIFGIKGDGCRKLHSRELQALYCSPVTVRMIKSRRKR
jgi:hypothetical protein